MHSLSTQFTKSQVLNLHSLRDSLRANLFTKHSLSIQCLLNARSACHLSLQPPSPQSSILNQSFLIPRKLKVRPCGGHHHGQRHVSARATMWRSVPPPRAPAPRLGSPVQAGRRDAVPTENDRLCDRCPPHRHSLVARGDRKTAQNDRTPVTGWCGPQPPRATVGPPRPSRRAPPSEASRGDSDAHA